MLLRIVYRDSGQFLTRIDEKGYLSLNGQMVQIYPCHIKGIYSWS